MGKKGKRVVFTVSIAAHLAESIDRIAKLRRQTRSAVAEELLEAGVQQDELGVKVWSDPILSQAMSRALMSGPVLKQLGQVLLSEVSEDQLKLFTEATEAAVKAASKVSQKGKKK